MYQMCQSITLDKKGELMEASKLILVSDQPSIIESVRLFANRYNLHLEVRSISQWQHQREKGFGKVLDLPEKRNSQEKNIPTILEMESTVIRNAVFQLHGNLTGTSKALGIGRATLYRKLKQYNIDVKEARRRRYQMAS